MRLISRFFAVCANFCLAFMYHLGSSVHGQLEHWHAVVVCVTSCPSMSGVINPSLWLRPRLLLAFHFLQTLFIVVLCNLQNNNKNVFIHTFALSKFMSHILRLSGLTSLLFQQRACVVALIYAKCTASLSANIDSSPQVAPVSHVLFNLNISIVASPNNWC